uniref:Uncharacterized protein n=1 Tax=viral metagenome TaxID=1070528 RepID=A0A6C0KHY9_9ZZZZ
MPITISLKSLAGDLVQVEIESESGSTCVRALREKAAHLFGLAKCTHVRPAEFDMSLDESQKWKIIGSCPQCTLHPANIGLIRQTEKWERLGNSHCLVDGEEVSYIIRKRPDTGLTNEYSPNRMVWSRLYNIPEINSENVEYQLRRLKMHRVFFSFTNGKFHNVECSLWRKYVDGEFDTLEELLHAINQSPTLRYKFSEENIADTVHLWDVNGQ